MNDKPYFIIHNKENSNEPIVLVNDEPPLLIPTKFYQPEYQKEYLQYQFDVANIGKIFEAEIEDYTALYFLNHHDYFNLSQQYSRISFEHRLLHYYFKTKKLSPPTQLHSQFVILCDKQKADFWLTKQHVLQLMNRFYFTNSYDFLFHTLHILHQYQIPVEESLLILYQFSPLSRELQKILNQYFTHLLFPTE